jgi:hypothetical protein
MPAALAKQWPPSRGLFHANHGVSCAPDKQDLRAAGAFLLLPPGRASSGGFVLAVGGRMRWGGAPAVRGGASAQPGCAA